ncbi:helix-turn-helix domain-containing protein [Streptomyces sp. SGAir0957]
MGTPDLERLAAQVRQRRATLGLNLEPAAASVGMSKDTWKKVEAGQKVRDTSYARVEKALQWAPGSIGRILAGKQPITASKSQGGADDDTRLSTIPKPELERAVGDAVQAAAMRTKGSLTADEILELNDRVLQELRERGIL